MLCRNFVFMMSPVPWLSQNLENWNGDMNRDSWCKFLQLRDYGWRWDLQVPCWFPEVSHSSPPTQASHCGTAGDSRHPWRRGKLCHGKSGTIQVGLHLPYLIIECTEVLGQGGIWGGSRALGRVHIGSNKLGVVHGSCWLQLCCALIKAWLNQFEYYDEMTLS